MDDIDENTERVAPELASLPRTGLSWALWGAGPGTFLGLEVAWLTTDPAFGPRWPVVVFVVAHLACLPVLRSALHTAGEDPLRRWLAIYWCGGAGLFLAVLLHGQSVSALAGVTVLLMNLAALAFPSHASVLAFRAHRRMVRGDDIESRNGA